MNNDQPLHLEPYTSINLTSLIEKATLLEEILSSDTELHPRKINKPVVLYGAGNLGKMAKDFFGHLNMPFMYVVDKNAAGYQSDKFWQGTRVIQPDNVSTADKKDSLLVVCIVTVPLIAMRDELAAAGWKDIAFFYDVAEAYRDCHPIGNGWFMNKTSENEKESIKKVYNSLSDDVSRMHYLQFITWRRLRIELRSGDSEINVNNRFFIPEVVDVLNENEVFVDCGAHNGSVVKKFLDNVKHKYKNIYAIEPDRENFKSCRSVLKDIKDVSMIECALGDRAGEGNFNQGFDFASRLGTSGKSKVKIVTLDSLNVPATFIKMHIEGGELTALKGSSQTIKKYRPILAVTTYHNPDGVCLIPNYFIDNARDYLFLMRLHSWAGTGAVFYAIPKERS